ncbi:MAG TPA: outer membrane beta-barrel protein [Rhizomicrobium sp.]|jgi:opacity protein-like surface antigen|nr:outer membrane beta-barrel protein [Rhizomicrobium sp.]
MLSRSLLLASVFAATSIVATATAAQADDWDGWNISLMGGQTYSPHLSVGGAPAKVDNGFNAGGRLGYDLGDWTGVRGLELATDIFYTQSDYGVRQARLSSLSFMGDVIYHVDLGLPVGVYGGAGVGGVRTMINNPTVDSGGTVFAWQALGGVDYQLTPESKLFAEYRYQNAHDANVGSVHGVGYTSNNVSAGIKIDL